MILVKILLIVNTLQLVGGMAAGMFGAVFNTPGDVIRSTIQKRFLSAEPAKVHVLHTVIS